MSEEQATYNKSIPSGFPDKKNKLTLSCLSAVYTQLADEADESGNGDQMFTISTEDAGAGIYYVVSTQRWAIDEIDDLIHILQDFKSKLGNQK